MDQEKLHKYRPYPPVQLTDRTWPDKVITKAPIWCSVDLRDGNQALVQPMNLEEKLEMFQLLVRIGFKEIEVGFPSASQIEYDFLRLLIDGNHIPDGVVPQVLTQAREQLIKKSFASVQGAREAIVHLYNSTSTLQRDIVFKKGRKEIIDLGVAGARIIREQAGQTETKIRYEYSPESFTGTELDFALEICEAIMDVWEPTPENPVIINLPATVEMSTPNIYADQIEWFCRQMKSRDCGPDQPACPQRPRRGGGGHRTGPHGRRGSGRGHLVRQRRAHRQRRYRHPGAQHVYPGGRSRCSISRGSTG